MLMEKENKEEKEVGRHPDSRRWGPPAFPHRKPPGEFGEGEGRMCRGRWEPAGTLATPGAGGDAGAVRREA